MHAMNIRILPRQLPCSHDVRVYGFDGRCPGTAYAPHALRSMPLLVKLSNCDHAAKTLTTCERHYDFITWNSPEIGSDAALSVYF